MINNYKRQTREMPQYVRDKIAAKMMGHTVSDETRRKISDGQRRAWAQIPPKGNNNGKEQEGNVWH